MKKLIINLFIISLLITNGTKLFSQSFELYTEEEIQEAEDMAKSSAAVDKMNSVMSSESKIDWTKQSFTSDVVLDVQKAGIPLPSGKTTALNKIQMELPVLVKDPLCSIYVDNLKSIGDMVLEGSITLEELTRIVDSSKQTPAYFSKGSSDLLTTHTIDLKNISAILVKHRIPYTQMQPIQNIATRAFSGIIIDARGSLNVQGEFIESKGYPCLFPKVWTENMDLVYERNMVNPETAKKDSIVVYGSDEDFSKYAQRVGKDPLWITARKIYGVNRTDPVISYEDYLKITTVEQNLELLKQGKVVILLDKEQLVHPVSAPEKNKNYYLTYQKLRKYFYEAKVPDTVVLNAPKGIQITVQNLRFIADSPKLLPEEDQRLSLIASSLKKISESGDFTILIEGHTADVNKPDGQLTLSILRAQSVIDAFVAAGINRELFSYKGYGGTKPVATNSTPEGRALNRRVEIIVMPKDSFTQTK